MTDRSAMSGIVAREVRKSFGTHTVLNRVSLTVDEGTVFALLGPNGAGKTTMVRILSTLISADSGSMRIAGHDVVTDPNGVRAVIGVTGQFSAVDNLLTGAENLRLMADLRHLGREAGQRRVAELLEQFELTDAADKPLSTYSGGMRRRLDLAMTLVGQPRVIFLDEPTTGLDPRSRLAMWQIVRDLASAGVTILLTTQYLDEADQLADRIAVIDGGQVIAEGTPTELKASMGSQRLLITLAEGADAFAAAAALRPFATGAVNPNEWDRLLEVPVTASDGLATDVVRALDAAGVKVSDIAVRSASLDDVFLTLTGHKAEEQARENKTQGVPA
jgi:ABC-2 type transport system ATP-binding protein